MNRTAISTAALGLALALAGCHGQPPAAGNDATANVAGDAAVANVSEAANVIDQSSASGGGSEAQATAAPVQVVAVPVPAAAAPAADAAPLDDAAAVAVAIDRGGYDRVRSGDGWAWRRDGQIVRTASLDGRRVAYFHPGNRDPYLVQDDGHAYEYQGGRMRQAFDEHGRAIKADAGRQREAEQAARDARSRHDAAPAASRPAQRAPSDHPVTIDHGGSDGRDHAAPPPAADPGPQGNRVTEHKGRSDGDRDETAGARDGQGGRRDPSDRPHS